MHPLFILTICLADLELQLTVAALPLNGESIISRYGLGKDQNSKFKVWFLPNCFHHHVLKTPKLNHHVDHRIVFCFSVMCVYLLINFINLYKQGAKDCQQEYLDSKAVVVATRSQYKLLPSLHPYV